MGPPQVQPPQVVVQAGPAAVVEASDRLVGRVAGLTPQQAQTVAVILLTVVICCTMLYQMWSGQRNQAETLALVIRSMESESEKNRSANAVEFERNRTAFMTEGRANRDAITDGVKLTIASHQKLSTELGKLEQVVSTLNTTITDLKRKIGGAGDEYAPEPGLRGGWGISSGTPRRP